jgi:hypothetical protein
MTATQILQTYLDTMSDHVLQGDFDGYQRGVALPFHLVTTDTNVVVTSPEALREGFDHFRAMLLSQQVTAYIRLVATALLLDERLISGHYTTHVIAGGTRIMAPFQSQIVLRHSDEHGWRGTSITNGAKNARWPIDRLVVNPPPDTEKPSSGTGD